MTKQEFLAMSLPYGLKVTQRFADKYEPYLFYGLKHTEYSPKWVLYFDDKRDGNYQWSFIDGIAPIIRPFTDLYKECIQADYKNGEAFIPIVELARIACENKSAPWVITKEMTCVYNDRYKDEFRLYDGFFHVISDNCRNSFTYIPPQFELFQQLIKWHFWHNMKEDEQVIYVTEEFNPYI